MLGVVDVEFAFASTAACCALYSSTLSNSSDIGAVAMASSLEATAVSVPALVVSASATSVARFGTTETAWSVNDEAVGTTVKASSLLVELVPEEGAIYLHVMDAHTPERVAAFHQSVLDQEERVVKAFAPREERDAVCSQEAAP